MRGEYLCLWVTVFVFCWVLDLYICFVVCLGLIVFTTLGFDFVFG